MPSVKFSGLKMCQRKKKDKYQVWVAALGGRNPGREDFPRSGTIVVRDDLREKTGLNGGKGRVGRRGGGAGWCRNLCTLYLLRGQ